MKQILKKEVTLDGTRLYYKYKNRHSLDEIALQILNDSVEDGFIRADNDKDHKQLIYDCGSMQSLDRYKGVRIKVNNVIALLESLRHILTYLEDSFIDIEYAVFNSEDVFLNDKMDELHIVVIPTQDDMMADVSLRKFVKNLIVTFSYGSSEAADLMKKALGKADKSMKNIDDLDNVISLLKKGAENLHEPADEENEAEDGGKASQTLTAPEREPEAEEESQQSTLSEEEAAEMHATGVDAEQINELAASVQEAMRRQAEAKAKAQAAAAAQNAQEQPEAGKTAVFTPESKKDADIEEALQRLDEAAAEQKNAEEAGAAAGETENFSKIDELLTKARAEPETAASRPAEAEITMLDLFLAEKMKPKKTADAAPEEAVKAVSEEDAAPEEAAAGEAPEKAQEEAPAQAVPAAEEEAEKEPEEPAGGKTPAEEEPAAEAAPAQEEPVIAKVPAQAEEKSEAALPDQTAAEASEEIRRDIIAEYKTAIARRDAAYLVRRRTGEVINLQQDIFIIGKIPFCCDYLVADNPAVSRIHAIIRYNSEEKIFYIFDCRATNHVYINGKRIAPEEAVQLHDLDRIHLATEEFIYHA